MHVISLIRYSNNCVGAVADPMRFFELYFNGAIGLGMGYVRSIGEGVMYCGILEGDILSDKISFWLYIFELE